MRGLRARENARRRTGDVPPSRGRRAGDDALRTATLARGKSRGEATLTHRDHDRGDDASTNAKGRSQHIRCNRKGDRDEEERCASRVAL